MDNKIEESIKNIKQAPKVSIIVAIFNAEKYLREALDSVLNQTLFDIECICVDDCSIDNSLAILNEYAKKDSRIKVFSMDKNSGPGVVRNYGLEKATGEYIMILDPDDFLELEACEVAYNQISKNNNDLVIFDNYKYNQITKVKNVYRNKIIPFLEYLQESNIKLQNIDKPYFTTGWSVTQIYRRSFLVENNIKYPNLYLCEDASFMVQAFVKSSSVSILDKPIYNYRVGRSGSLTLNTTKWRQVFIGKLYGVKYIENSPYRENFRKMYFNSLVKSIMYYAKHFAMQDFKVGVEYYKRMRKTYSVLNKKYDMKKYIDLKVYRMLTKTAKLNDTTIYLICINFKLKAFIKKIFSIKYFYDESSKKIKVLTMLGKRYIMMK